MKKILLVVVALFLILLVGFGLIHRSKEHRVLLDKGKKLSIVLFRYKNDCGNFPKDLNTVRDDNCGGKFSNPSNFLNFDFSDFNYESDGIHFKLSHPSVKFQWSDSLTVD